MGHGRGDAEVAGVLRLWSSLPRRREVRSRVGDVEDVPGTAGDGRGSVSGDGDGGAWASSSRECYAATLGVSHENTILTAYNIAGSLGNMGRFEEMKPFLRDQLSVARKSLGADPGRHIGP